MEEKILKFMKKEYFHRYPESHLHKSTFGKPNFRDFYANIKFKASMRLTTPGIEKFVKCVFTGRATGATWYRMAVKNQAPM